jgi:beta-ureidopropionase / N-carbamoyl-L-amino-acid hydrolase
MNKFIAYKNLQVNGKRLQQSMEKMAKIGGTPRGGVHRLSLTDEDKEARDLFIQWLKEIGLDVKIDQIGNIFGVKAGKDNNLLPVISGSHLDSQPKGGRFDGTLGVLGTLEALRTLHERKIETKRPIVIVDWTNEEGSRFAPAMVGSGVWTGKLDLQYAYSRVDVEDKKFGEELERIGYKGDHPAKGWPFHAYFEYHIEQGPILELKKKLIGIPKGIVCIYWFDIHLQGAANQVGPTPMEGRNDALCAAAEMILKLNALPAKMGGDLVATVGEIHNYPNSRNIIPDTVDFTVDIRSWEENFALQAWELVRKDFQAIAARWGCPIEIEETWHVPTRPFDKRLVNIVRQAAIDLGYSTYDLVSGAGHDASYMASVGPTAMIFVPSIGGRSHVEVEKTSWEDCEAGANVLLFSLLKAAME